MDEGRHPLTKKAQGSDDYRQDNARENTAQHRHSFMTSSAIVFCTTSIDLLGHGSYYPTLLPPAILGPVRHEEAAGARPHRSLTPRPPRSKLGPNAPLSLGPCTRKPAGRGEGRLSTEGMLVISG